MTTVSSAGWNSAVYADQYDITSWLDTADASLEMGLEDVSTLGVAAKQYAATIADGGASLSGLWWNTAGAPVDSPQEYLAAVLGSTASRYLTIALEGADTVGDRSRSLKWQRATIKPTIKASNVLRFSIDVKADGGIDLGYLIRPKVTENATTTGTGHDDLGAPVSTTNGARLYVHVFSLTGTSPTQDITIEHSADNGGVDPWAALITVPQISTASAATMVAVTGTVKRYIRYVNTLKAGATSIYALSFCRQ